MKNRKAWRLIAILSVVILSAIGVLVTIYPERLFGSRPIVRFLKHSGWGFGQSGLVITAGGAALYSAHRYKCGFFAVYLEQPLPAHTRKLTTAEWKGFLDAVSSQ